MSTSPLAIRRGLLPQPSTSLIGRDREVEALCSFLSRADVRVVTITGPGGIGKTRLAIEAAARLGHDFKDGLCFVPLASVQDPDLFLTTIALHVGLRDIGGLSPVEQLHRDLSAKQMLLVLDNFEQLVSAAPLLHELLEYAVGVKAIVTSRTLLRISNEYAFPALPLASPPPNLITDVDSIELFDAVRLFVSRAQAIRAGFTISHENAHAVSEFCRRVDGLPLAIELAAARINILSPQGMIERLDQRLPLLTGGARNAPVRLQSLKDAIAWSFDLLTRDEQLLFRRLAVFESSFTFDAVSAIASAVVPLAIDPLIVLGSLVDQSLVQAEEQPDTTTRYSLLQTIREFSFDRLIEAGERDAVLEAHAHYFLAFASEANSNLWGPTQSAWLARIERDRANLNAALVWFIDHDWTIAALKLATALFQFWLMHGHLREGQTWLKRSLDPSADAPAELVVDALYASGVFSCLRGNYDEAALCAERIVTLSTKAEDDLGRGKARSLLSHIEDGKGNFKQSVTHAEASLDHMRRAGNEARVAFACNRLGVALVHAGERERAAIAYDDAVSLWRSVGNSWGLALSLDGLAQIASENGENARALALRQEALRLSWEMGELRITIEALIGIAAIAVARQHYETAIRLLAVADTESFKIGFDPYSFPRLNRQKALEALRAEFGDFGLDAALAANRDLSLEQVATEALSLNVSPDTMSSSRVTGNAFEKLTNREYEVLQLISSGMSNQSIADALFIERGTVKTHVANILAKLGLETRTEAAAYAHRNKLTPAHPSREVLDADFS